MPKYRSGEIIFDDKARDYKIKEFTGWLDLLGYFYEVKGDIDSNYAFIKLRTEGYKRNLSIKECKNLVKQFSNTVGNIRRPKNV